MINRDMKKFKDLRESEQADLKEAAMSEKEVQRWNASMNKWITATCVKRVPDFGARCVYRIKPEPKSTSSADDFLYIVKLSRILGKSERHCPRSARTKRLRKALINCCEKLNSEAV